MPGGAEQGMETLSWLCVARCCEAEHTKAWNHYKARPCKAMQDLSRQGMDR